MMPSAREFRRYLDEALHSADKAATPEQRAAFLQIARTWHEAALAAERSMGLVAESRDLLDLIKKTT
jgi:hypothetical protein